MKNIQNSKDSLSVLFFRFRYLISLLSHVDDMGNKMGNNLNPISDIMFEELFYESEYFIREFPTSLSHFRISQIDNNTLTQINVDRVLLKSRVNHALENIKGYESFKRLIYNFEIILIDLDLLKQMIDTCEIVFPVTMDS